MSTIVVVSEPHDGAVAVVFRDLLDGEIEVFVAGGGDFVFGGFFFGFRGHRRSSLGTAARGSSPSRKAPRGCSENDDRPQTSRLAACAPNQKQFAYATAILRGLTCSAFGRVNVTTPCSIFALILPASIDGSSSNERRKFSVRDSRWSERALD